MAEAKTIGRYRVAKVLHHGKALVQMGHSPTGDAVVIKSGPNECIHWEKQCLLRLKSEDPQCEHVVRLIDFVDEQTSSAQSDATAADSEEFEVVDGLSEQLRLEAHLVLEKADESLESWLRTRNYKPSWSEVLDCGHSLGVAIEWIHSQGMAHSDVKPSNFLRFHGRVWKLSDFGSATDDGEVCRELTTSYCAPEQATAFLAGKAVIASSDADVWAFAKILYEMGCGNPSSLVPTDLANAENHTAALQHISSINGSPVNESQLRFPVLRSVLKATLQVSTPRMSMAKVMQRGFWTGNATISLDEGDRSGSASSSQQTNLSDRKKAKAVLELLETEKEYCSRLETLVVSVIQPMLQTWRKGELEVEETQLQIFSDLEGLHRSNEFFKQQLHKRIETEGNIGVGEIMNQFARTLLRNYESYIGRFYAAHQNLHKEKRRSKDFRRFADLKIGENQQSLDDYLILPVQRLPRYKLLLERIVIFTEDTSSDEFRKLQEALAAVSDTCDAINEHTNVMKSPKPKSLMSFASWSESNDGTSGPSPTLIVLGAAATALGVYLVIRERNLARAQEAAKLALEAERLKHEGAVAMARAAQAAAEMAKAKETTKMVGVSGALAVAALFLLSDARVKTNIRKVGRSKSGITTYHYAYVWEPDVMWQGAMAQDLLASSDISHRQAVHALPSGVFMVDYSQLDVVAVCLDDGNRGRLRSSACGSTWTR